MVVVVAVVEIFNAQALGEISFTFWQPNITPNFTIGRVCSLGCDFESL
jgi:hypothetical protein